MGRAKEKEILDHLLAQWRENSATPLVALVGANGSGKTSLLNWLQGQCRSTETIHRVIANQRIRSKTMIIDCIGRFLQTDRSNDETELARQINQLPGRIALVDDAHCFTLRAMGASEVLFTFMEIVLSTQTSCFWVMSFDEQVWRRLNYLYGFNRYFSDVIELSYFNSEELAALLETRLKSSGLKLTLDKADEAEPKESNSVQDTSAESCARNLSELSGGNMTAALYQWILCAQYHEVDKTLRFEPGKKPDLSFLETLDQAEQFTLVEVLTNGELTVDEHSQIFQWDVPESRLILHRLCLMHLLIREHIEETRILYRINPILYKPITTALIHANLLY